MDIYIHKDVLGFNDHLIYRAGELRKIKEIPDDAPLVFGEEALVEISKLYGITLPSFPPRNYVKAFQTVLGSQNVSEVPWKFALPPGAFKRSLVNLCEELTRLFSGVDLTYYRTHFRKTSKVLWKMKRAKIDLRAWKYHSEMTEDLITPHVFNTFQPDEDGFASAVVYSHADTKTGRLKVIEGPNILHLPKEQRNILTSRFGKNGKIWSMDYSSLEPRTVLYLKSINPSQSLPGYLPHFGDNADIYTEVLKHLGTPNISREVVKEVVLSQLYGAGIDTIISKLEGVKDVRGFIDAVNDFFGLDQLRARLLEEYESNNREFILSHYGRRVDTREAKPYMLLNYHVQTTAVDVALYGFLNMLRAISGNQLIVPLFVLVDALIVDAHNDAQEKLKELCEVGSKDIPLFNNAKFPLKLSRF